MSTARDETRDGFYMEDGDPSVAQLLHERTFAFSFWPKVGGILLLFDDQNNGVKKIILA